MSKKLPYPESLARSYSPGVTPDRRRIKSCSERGAWYRRKIGSVVTVHYFGSFGAYDTEGRWIWYYDLSAPVTDEDITASIWKRIKSFFKKVFG